MSDIRMNKLHAAAVANRLKHKFKTLYAGYTIAMNASSSSAAIPPPVLTHLLYTTKRTPHGCIALETEEDLLLCLCAWKWRRQQFGNDLNVDELLDNECKTCYS
jgi:hypothetical protein